MEGTRGLIDSEAVIKKATGLNRRLFQGLLI